jgi:hypothetical protein
VSRQDFCAFWFRPACYEPVQCALCVAARREASSTSADGPARGRPAKSLALSASASHRPAAVAPASHGMSARALAGPAGAMSAGTNRTQFSRSGCALPQRVAAPRRTWCVRAARAACAVAAPAALRSAAAAPAPAQHPRLRFTVRGLSRPFSQPRRALGAAARVRAAGAGAPGGARGRHLPGRAPPRGRRL